MYTQREIDSGASNASSYPIGTDWKYNNASSVSWDALTGNGLANGRGGTPYEPVQFSAYASDKIEQQGTFITAGIRFDALLPHMMLASIPGAHTTPMFDTFASYMAVRPGFDSVADVLNPEARYLPIEEAKPLFQISPRFGIAARVMESLLLRASYGTYQQIPPFTTSYNVSWSGESSDANLNGQIDDYEWLNQASGFGASSRFAKAERSTNLEFGIDWNAVLDYTVSLTMYYRQGSRQQLPGGTAAASIFEPSGPIQIPMGPTLDYYTTLLATSDGFGDVKGLEVAVLKNFRSYFGLRAALNWTQASGEESSGESFRRLIPDSSSVASGRWWTEWETQPDGTMIPVVPDSEDLQLWGARSNVELRRLGQDPAYTLDREDVVPGMHSFTSDASLIPGDLYVFGPASPSLAERLHGSRQLSGSVLAVVSVPPDMGPSIKGFSPFGGWKGTLIYRMVSGLEVGSYLLTPELRAWTATVGPTVKHKLPLESRVDFGFSRSIHIGDGGICAEFFMDIANLFNDRNLTPDLVSASDGTWINYGLLESSTGSAPLDPYTRKFIAQEAHIDLGTPRQNPRFTEVGIRLSF